GRVKAMSASCCNHTPGGRLRDRRYRRILWSVLAINAAMFLIEIVAGLAAGSASLQADALDFFADAANYGISLFVVGMPQRYRAGVSLIKGMTMALSGRHKGINGAPRGACARLARVLRSIRRVCRLPSRLADFGLHAPWHVWQRRADACCEYGARALGLPVSSRAQ